MIDRQEIMDFAKEFGLAPNVVEKDFRWQDGDALDIDIVDYH